MEQFRYHPAATCNRKPMMQNLPAQDQKEKCPNASDPLTLVAKA
jgi:hypothetical protein